jgi:hypothetical protein
VADGLTLSRDRKVAPGGYWDANYGRWVPNIRNSFGLPAGRSCPGQTAWCRDICYGANAERSAGVHGALERNLELLQEAGTVEAMAELLTQAVARFAAVAERRRLFPEERIFRIHWDGDFFSTDYAEAWLLTVDRFPEITFWCYTRSFVAPVDVVPILGDVENLRLYLSVDEHNAAAAHEQVRQHPRVHLALCAETYNEAKMLAPGRWSIVCPENDGRMELMKDGRGACVTCGLCPNGRADVRFKTSRPSDKRRSLPVIQFARAPANPLECPECHGPKSKGGDVCRGCANERMKRRVEIHCPCGRTKQIPKSLYDRKAKVHYCSLSCRARFTNLARPRAMRCRRKHLLTPENTIVLRSGTRRCRTCNNLRKLWHDHGGSLPRVIAWAKWACGPEAPDLTDDEWERILRGVMFDPPKIVRRVILLPECTLDELILKHRYCGVDSLGRTIDPSEAWL